jgi:hypothetical protein
MVLVWVMVLIAATLASGKIYSDSSISSQSTEPAHSMLRMNWSANGISLRALHLEVSLNWSSVPRRTEQAYQPEQPK